ncbi:hypothetical protein QYE76_041757 [Lolium multiflorum]|uniref:Transposase (putative) gypsy type domain-containing protein n=1 Tax=Lolium multiflorum TaxID=4521 RepID=A0AAD8TFL9_LOLMU|nr:hypothetical protein QYE76_041757 [Lolium multiflorum]
MPPRTKLIKHTTPGTNTPMDKVEIFGWERSKISNQDQKTLKKLGMLKKQDSLIFPGDESFSRPPIGYRVTFIDHLIRGLSTPIHEFLRGLLFVYGIQLHQLTPNSILHILIFITLCECFLGTHPHWSLWKRIFYLRRNNSRNIVYNVGGVCICVRPEVDYFDVKFPDSVQGWHRRWLYIQEEYVNSQEYDIAPFDGAAEILRRRSWDAEPVMKHLIKLGTQFIGFRDEADDLREALRRAEKCADALAAKLEQSEKAREKAEQDAVVVGDLRQRLHNAESALSDKVSQQIAVVDVCSSKLKRRIKNIDKINDAVTPIAEKMIDEPLRVDDAFFHEYHYADALDAPAEGEKVTIDSFL